MEKKSLVVDIGGTNMRIGLAQDGAQILSKTHTPRRREDILEGVAEFIEKTAFENNFDIQDLIVGCPGLITQNGTIQAALYWEAAGLGLADFLDNRFAAVRVTNDANLQAWGATSFVKHGVFLSFGTGVGGAVISEGRVLEGNRGFAGEFGHAKASEKSTQCLCGRRGCLDTLASGYWLEKTLGAGWWEKSPETQIESAMAEAAFATVQSTLEFLRLMDLDTICLTGHIVHQKSFRHGVEGALQEGEDRIRLLYVDETWSLVTRGAERMLATRIVGDHFEH